MASRRTIVPQPGPPDASSVQFMITNRMKGQLADLGYSPSEVRLLAPERARAIISRSIRRPSRGVPKEWQRAAGRGGSGGAGGLGGLIRPIKLVVGPALLAYALYAAEPELFNEMIAPVKQFAHRSIMGVRQRLGLKESSKRKRAVRGGGYGR